MTESMPIWVLSFSYWIHMIATVIWLGGLISITFVVLPFIQKKITGEEKEKLLSSLQNYLNPLGWFCLFILVGTGMFQMSAHPSYQGFLSIENDWAVALFIKHIFIIFMVIAMGYLTWFVLPGLKRIALKQKLGKDIDSLKLLRYRNQERLILWTNSILAIFVLIFTAWARSVS
ncbi:MAG: hypothetical protein CVU40_01035 [Chloroflexi bacterium HGW-Chloroflexi-2]|jgi:uncharacterized membrane protein|nr:MAG: hypothetical protein CVU40_01035 [Chloroflexi bacterium HGW-Chloroflexi-2]